MCMNIATATCGRNVVCICLSACLPAVAASMRQNALLPVNGQKHLPHLINCSIKLINICLCLGTGHGSKGNSVPLCLCDGGTHWQQWNCNMWTPCDCNLHSVHRVQCLHKPLELNVDWVGGWASAPRARTCKKVVWSKNICKLLHK